MGSSDLHLILHNPSALNQLHQITEFYDQKMIITIRTKGTPTILYSLAMPQVEKVIM